MTDRLYEIQMLHSNPRANQSWKIRAGNLQQVRALAHIRMLSTDQFFTTGEIRRVK